MRALIIEASTERGAIGLTVSGKLLISKELPFGNQQSKYLMTSIDEILKETGISPRELQAIALGAGPGSYTGIRMAAAIAKSLAYACQIPLIGFCSLKAFLPKENDPFAVIIDAKIAGAYLIKGEKQGKNVVYLEKPKVTQIEELGEELKDVIQLVTPNKKRIKQRLLEAYPDNNWKWEESPPNLEHLLGIVEEKFRNKEWKMNGEVELLYLRGKGAQW